MEDKEGFPQHQVCICGEGMGQLDAETIKSYDHTALSPQFPPE